jgi:hypothetical protein
MLVGLGRRELHRAVSEAERIEVAVAHEGDLAGSGIRRGWGQRHQSDQPNDSEADQTRTHGTLRSPR